MSAEETAPTGVAPTEPRGGIEHRRLKTQIRSALFGASADPVKIGRFTVLRRLGVGGMGVVYSAYDDELDRKVAIKLLLPDQLGEEGPERLRREAQAVAKLSHPNVVNVFETGEHAGQLFVAMEFVRGKTLREWAAESDRRWREVLSVFLQAGRGLQAAHSAGLVHRDFKPDNVMVGDDGRVRVLDFGVARTVAEPHESANGLPADVLDGEPVELTRTGAAVGTPAYMAPEQHAGAKADPRTDQYAFCLALWEALYGEYPFDNSSFLTLARSKGAGQIPTPSRPGDVPAVLRKLVERGLAPEPGDRHASMDELLVALGRIGRGRRRFVPALLLAAAAGGGLATFALMRSEECERADEKLAAAWNGSKIREALRGRGEAGLGDAWLDLEPKLDDFASRWRDAYQQACATDDVDEEQRLQRMRCLEAGLNTLGDATAGLDSADVPMLRAAADKAERWDEPADCIDASRLRLWAERHAMRNTAAPEGSEHTLVSDFEGELASSFGVGWVISKDKIAGGDSEAEVSVRRGGAGGSGHALVVVGEVKSWPGGETGWAGTMFFPGESPLGPANLTGKSRLSFDIRATAGEHQVMLFTQSTGWNPQHLVIETSEDWTRVDVDLDDLPVERYDTTGIFIGRTELGKFELRIDNVRLE